MATETHALMAATAAVINHKRMAQVLGVSLQHTYTLCRDPVELDAPVRNDADRHQALLTELAAHPEGRPTLIQWRMAWNQFFARVIDHRTPRPLTPDNVVAYAAKVCKETGDVLAECGPAFAPDRLFAQIAELQDVLEQLAEMAEAADDGAESGAVRLPPRIRRA